MEKTGQRQPWTATSGRPGDDCALCAVLLQRPGGKPADLGALDEEALFYVGQQDLPFGGIGESGTGHYHGREGFETFSELRPIFHQARSSSVGLLDPPSGRLAERMIAFLTR